MPLYYFQCETCGKEFRRILKPEEATSQPCACGSTLKRDPHPPSSRVTEVLDNGLMTKRIERLADAERLFRERNEATRKSQRGD